MTKYIATHTESRVTEAKAAIQEAWDRERETREDELEQWKAEKIGELYDMIVSQMNSGKIGPGFIARTSWLSSDLPERTEDDGRSS
jgi:hypothetical protein